MTQTPITSLPETQILEQVQAEASNEDLTGLSPDDLVTLSKDLWVWASSCLDRNQHVQCRTVKTDQGRDTRTLLEISGPDMPFLVDSLLAECANHRLEVRALFHPIVRLPDGQLQSVIQIHLSTLSGAESRRLLDGVKGTLGDVAVAVKDFAAMNARMTVEMTRLESVAFENEDDRAETIAFLAWLSANHFVFLGCREYKFATGKDGEVLAEEPLMVEGSNLGILRDENANVLTRDSEPLVLTPEIGALLSLPFPMIVAKSTLESRVHRRAYCDYIGVKQHDKDGRVNGEVRFLGLFTAEAYDQTARSIPFLRRRVSKVVEASGATPGGHSEKTLINILETWPRDELFQTSTKDLTPIVLGVLHLVGRPRTRLFMRRDPFDRFVSAIVYVPREAYDTELRQKMTALLTQAFDGQLVNFRPQFDSTSLCRVHFQIALERGHPEPDPAELEASITALARTWDSGFRKALMKADISEEEREGGHCFLGAFNAAYRETFDPDEALRDVLAIAGLNADTPIIARAFRIHKERDDEVRVKIYARDGSLPLSRCVPVFENMGLFVHYEKGFPVRPVDKPVPDAPDTYWVHSIRMTMNGGAAIDIDAVAAKFEDAFVAVWRGLAENDRFNGLVLRAESDWREAALIRSLCAYRRLSGMEPPQSVQENAFMQYPALTRVLLNLFAERFDPALGHDNKTRAASCAKIRAEFDEALGGVGSLIDDQIMRRTANLIAAIQRTNFYQVTDDGAPESNISFKIASRELSDLPEPKPFREIFTSSPRVEGVHLRFGAVARGGLRWSDRESDYRTEVLGLVKAQQVKNAVIVPAGSKGGFYPKQLPGRGDRNAWFEAGRDAYKEFITALLGLTDNLDGSDVSHPNDTVIWDGEDPYLVVAADKGTATFSDTANAISEARGFWLGDAFASGGSVGYDHKKMGITARGGWEAVKRHFREIGKDIQTEPFTVIGCGDMSGDVFGNGMLLSEQIKLIAAFNHLHIFIDPDPSDTKASWTERKRLFDTPNTSWADYESSLISAGGGIFERSAKSISLTPEIQKMSGLSKESATPDELLHAILKADAELLWFGGIGTYVKAAHETHSEVGDRANDLLRVDGRELKVKVIGEGANLGMTQAARIEFARNGGRLNTDAIDNSAGVDSSDHEVNIKILAAEAIRRGDLKPTNRNDLLAKMTDSVADHVLVHNYDQTAALSLAEATVRVDHDAFGRAMLYLEERGVLNRPLEGLPSISDMAERATKGDYLTRPELAVILAWSKIVLFDDLIASDVPDDPHFSGVAKAYFPEPISQYGDAIDAHRLKREIIATILANRSLDMAGPAAFLRLRELTGAESPLVVRGLEAARAVLDYPNFLGGIDALDNKVPADLQAEMKLDGVAAMADAAAWFVRNTPHMKVDEMVGRYHAPLDAFKKVLTDTQSSFQAAAVERRARAFVKRGAPDKLARWATAMASFSEGLNIVSLSEQLGVSVADAAQSFFVVGDALRLDRLRASARAGLIKAGYWDRVAARRLIADLQQQQASEAERVISLGGPAAWLDARADDRKRLVAMMSTLSKDRVWSFAKFALAADATRQFMNARS